MEALFATLAVGAVWWYVVTFFWIVVILWTIDNEDAPKVGTSIVFLVLYLCLLQWVSKVDMLGALVHHPLSSVLYIAGYLGIGFVWSFARWWLHVRDLVEKLNKEAWMKDSRQYRNPKSLVGEDLAKHLQKAWIEHVELCVPTLKDSKSRVTVWVLYWPLSMLWSLVNDFIHKVLQHLITKIRWVYDTIRSSALKGIV